MWRGFLSKRKRVRHWLTGGAIACALLIGVLIGPGREIVGQVLRGESLTDVLAGRSPGTRGAAGLVKIKGKELGLTRALPQQRVLPLLRTRDPIAPIDELALPGGAFVPEGDPIGVPGGGFSDPFIDPVYPADPIFTGPVGFPIVPPGNPGVIPPNPEPEPPVPVPPIPEPATWAMMMLGLAVVGAALRRARALKGATAPVR